MKQSKELENSLSQEKVNANIALECFEMMDEINFEDEVNDENRAHVVYSSPSFKNTLAISKGKPKKGFKIEDLPMLDSDSDSSYQCVILKPMNEFHVFARNKSQNVINRRFDVKIGDHNRYSSKLTSTEILSDLQLKQANLYRKLGNDAHFKAEKITVIRD